MAIQDGAQYVIRNLDVPLRLRACFEQITGKWLFFGVNDHVLLQLEADGHFTPLIMYPEPARFTVKDLELVAEPTH